MYRIVERISTTYFTINYIIMMKTISFLFTCFIVQITLAQTVCKRQVANFDYTSTGYDIQGTAELMDSAGTLTLTFSSDFSTSPGPDLYVYLTETGQAPTAVGNDDYEVAILTSNTGAQSYTLPSSVGINDYEYVTIHCKQYNHLWNSGQMSPETCYTYPTFSTVTLESCFSYMSPSGSNTWMNSGTYIDTLVGMSVDGGDSIITLNLTINTVDNSVTESATSNMLSANATNATYQWMDCNSNEIISGETNAEFTPEQNGSYAVIVTSANSCVDTSSCFAIHTIGINEANQEIVATLYPNPFYDLITIQSKDINPNSIQVFNVLNQAVFFDLIQTEQNRATLNIKGPEGVYSIRVKNSNGDQSLIKAVKQ